MPADNPLAILIGSAMQSVISSFLIFVTSKTVLSEKKTDLWQNDTLFARRKSKFTLAMCVYTRSVYTRTVRVRMIIRFCLTLAMRVSSRFFSSFL